MYSTIFASLLAVSCLVSGFLVYYAQSWLGSVGRPADALAEHDYYSGLAWASVWVTAVALFIVANVVLWTFNRAWALWATLLYFAVFAVLIFFWLNFGRLAFVTENNLLPAGSLSSPLAGSILIIAGAFAAFFDQFLIRRLAGYSSHRLKDSDHVETPPDETDRSEQGRDEI